MSWVAGMQNPVVASGQVLTESLNYKCKASETFKKGELIRLTSAATVAVAVGVNTTIKAAVHGIALADAADYLTGGDYAGLPIPVALFDKDTVLAIQTNGAKKPSDFAAGTVCSLEASTTANYWTVLAVAAAGVVRAVGQPADAAWFDADIEGSAIATAPVYVSVLESVLDGVRAA